MTSPAIQNAGHHKARHRDRGRIGIGIASTYGESRSHDDDQAQQRPHASPLPRDLNRAHTGSANRQSAAMIRNATPPTCA